MKDVPMEFRGGREGSWFGAAGAVYLLHCRSTGVYKFGGSINPNERIRTHLAAGKRNGLDLEYVWSIATTGVGRLEMFWKDRWRRFRIDHRTEWVRLPPEEVSYFKSARSVVYPGGKPKAEHWECVYGTFRVPHLCH